MLHRIDEIPREATEKPGTPTPIKGCYVRHRKQGESSKSQLSSRMPIIIRVQKNLHFNLLIFSHRLNNKGIRVSVTSNLLIDCCIGNQVELRADILVPGFASRKLGQVPCEDVVIRFPIPECWIYLFRVEKHFRYGSVKSAHRRTGKIKGIERFLGTVDTLEPQLMEVTSGQAKYEHQHRAIVWRMPRLPKEGQGKRHVKNP